MRSHVPIRPGPLRYRRALPADFARCAELLPAGFRASRAVRQQLVGLWGRVMESESHTFSIVEDLQRPHPENIEAFGLSIFVTDRFFDDFCADPRPYLAALCYERMLAGDEVLLSRQGLRAALDTTGLNVVVLHFGLANEDLSDPRTSEVLATGSAAFYFFHSGYRIKALANEVYGPQAAEYMRLGGFRQQSDFPRESPADFAAVPPQQQPYLFLLRSEWVQPAVINPLFQLLTSPLPARIGFSNSERRVLEGALLNESDAQLAQRLGVSPDSIKKVWRNIYARAGREVPTLFPHGDPGDAGSRGREKRRYVLDYLRTHLEELRPSGPRLRVPSDRPNRSAADD